MMDPTFGKEFVLVCMERVGKQLFLVSFQVQVYIQVQEVGKHSMDISACVQICVIYRVPTEF